MSFVNKNSELNAQYYLLKASRIYLHKVQARSSSLVLTPLSLFSVRVRHDFVQEIKRF